MTSFEALNISAPILRALEKLSFDKPTEIQAASIPCLKEGHDLVGIAQTGGGKTAAFVIPMLERLAAHGDKPKPGMPRALILAPTRELAIQITEKIKELSVGTPARCCTVYGGAPYKTQIHILRRGVDILVATPGRLKDHMKQGNIYLDETEYFVLDEADRMLDMGFVDEVRDIAKKITSNHQSVMFSATMNAKVTELAATLLNDPIRVEVAREATIADNLEHKVMFVPGHQKRDLLLHLIEEWQPEKSLIFVRTRRDADEMQSFMEAMGFTADAIHGDKKQKIRQRTINNFKADKFDFLIATDVAARGIDVQDITHVFNLDTPVEAESYVHRIGRTARGGAHGKAVTLCGKSELRLLKDIEALIQMKIEVDEDNPYPLRLDNPKAQKFRDNRRSSGRRNDRSSGGNKPWEKRAKKRAAKAGEGRPEARSAKPFEGKRADRRSERPNRDKPWDQRDDRKGDSKPWQKRTEGRDDKSGESKPWKKREDFRGDRRTEEKPWKKRENARADSPTGEKPWKKREETRDEKPAAKKSWEKKAEGAVRTGKPTAKKTERKRVDPSANKRKSKAGAKAAKKRPAVAARKAKALQTKAFKKPSANRGGNNSGGNQPLRRRTK